MFGSTRIGSELTEPSSVGTAGLHFEDEEILSFGNTDAAPNVQILWETADANANALIMALPTGGGTDVPVFAICDASVIDVDLGFFNGITTPAIAVISADQGDYAYLAHDLSNALLRTNTGAFDFNVPIQFSTGVAGSGFAAQYAIFRNNDATNRLQFNVPTSGTFEWSENDISPRMALSTSLYVNVPIANFSSSANSLITLASTGMTLSRNVADANAALIVDQIHASSTGNILELHNVSAVQSHFNSAGQLIFDVGSAVTATDYALARNASNWYTFNTPAGGLFNFSMNGTTVAKITTTTLGLSTISNLSSAIHSEIVMGSGVSIRRNVADAFDVLTVSQTNVGGTGNLAAFDQQGTAQLIIGATGGLVWGGSTTITGANYSIARNADATNRMQLNVPSGALIEFSHNDVATAYMSSSGLGIPAVFNGSSGANAKVSFDTTGLTVERNVADANAALIADQIHASSTGNILELHNQSAVQTHFDYDGGLVFDVASTSVAGNYEWRKVGTTLRANVSTGGSYTWGVNGGAVMTMLTDGQLRPKGVANLTSQNNAWLDLPTTGANLSRNVADANAALIVDQIHASSTGNIQEWHKASSSVLAVDYDGQILFPSTGVAITGTNTSISRDNSDNLAYNVPTGENHSWMVNGITYMYFNNSGLFVNNVQNTTSANNAKIALSTTGATINRNVADANVALIIQQTHASSTGNIIEIKNDAATVGTWAQTGSATLSPEAITNTGTGDTSLSITQTINDANVAGGSDTYTGLKYNLTATDLTGVDNLYLFDYQVGGSSRIHFDHLNNLLQLSSSGATQVNIQMEDQGSGNNTAGRPLLIASGAGGSQTTGGAGADLYFDAGDAGGSGNNDGGSIFITPGSATGAGQDGVFGIFDTTQTENLGIMHDLTDVILANSAVGGGFSFQDDSFAEIFFMDGAEVAYSGRMLDNQGTDIASANDLTLGADGNSFEITGTTQVNAITTANWKNGSKITLLFTSTPTVKHNTAGGGGTAVILLAGAGDFAATAGDTLTLLLSEIGGTQAWREVARTAI